MNARSLSRRALTRSERKVKHKVHKEVLTPQAVMTMMGQSLAVKLIALLSLPKLATMFRGELESLRPKRCVERFRLVPSIILEQHNSVDILLVSPISNMHVSKKIQIIFLWIYC